MVNSIKERLIHLQKLLKSSNREKTLSSSSSYKCMRICNPSKNNAAQRIAQINAALDQTKSSKKSLYTSREQEREKLIFNHNKQRMNRKSLTSRQSNGFTLIEILVVVVIIGIAGSMALPTYRRTLAQGNVDRYTQFVESGLFNLRARLGRSRSSCQINLNEDFTGNNFGKPWHVLEFQGEDAEGKPNRFDDDRLRCCVDDGQASVCTVEQLAGEAPYRFINMEGTQESKQVELSATQATYDLSPPGTSVTADDLTILIRTVDFDELDADLQGRLLTRCVSLMGNGLVQAGTWSDEEKSCQSR